MRAIPTKRILPRWQKSFKELYVQDFLEQIIAPLATAIRQSADEDGELGFLQLANVQNRAGRLVRNYFVGLNYNPIQGLTPISPFAQRLAYVHANVVYEVIHAHNRWMQRTLPKAVYAFFANIETRPYPVPKPEDRLAAIRHKTQVRQMKVVETIHEDMPDNLQRIFSPNPLAAIDPQRQWVHFGAPQAYALNVNTVKSYRLSDDIWNASEDTRNEINKMLQDGVSQGLSAVEIADQLVNSFMPGYIDPVTFKPYGKGIHGRKTAYSYAAMRLARTEISRGFNQAAYTAAYTNPFVTGMDWLLSPSHPKVDICDTKATKAGGGSLDPYPMNAVDLPPAHPHCLCTAAPAVHPTKYLDTLQYLQDEMLALENSVIKPMVGPAQADVLISHLIDAALDSFLPLDFVRPSAVQGILPPPF